MSDDQPSVAAFAMTTTAQAEAEKFASVLLRKNHREAAGFMKSLCTSVAQTKREIEAEKNDEKRASLEACLKEKEEQIAVVFRALLSPTEPINEFKKLEQCKWLMAGGRIPDEFLKALREHDNAVQCGLVWAPNFVAYRCRTCALSPCMSMCSACFSSGNHEGHDFNMFRSQAGGACDCGDRTVMRDSGFCPRHGPDVAGPSTPPLQVVDELLSVVEFCVPHMLFRLLAHYRDTTTNSRRSSATTQPQLTFAEHVRAYSTAETAVEFEKADPLLAILQSLVDAGALARRVVARCLLSRTLYEHFFSPTTAIGVPATADLCSPSSSSSTQEENAYLVESGHKYEQALKSLVSIFDYAGASTGVATHASSPDDDFEWSELNPSLVHAHFLDELTFWLTRFEFPQKMVTFVLSLLPDVDYKPAFADAFVAHYSRMVTILAEQTSDSRVEHVSNRVIHISVQLLSNGELALELVRGPRRFLRLLVASFSQLLRLALTRSTMHTDDENEHLVVDCSHAIMENHQFWAILSDLHNVLNHEPIALQFLRDPLLVDVWCAGVLSPLQGANLQRRQLGEHVTFESRAYYSAFTTEIEASATTLWRLLEHFSNPNVSASNGDCMQYMLQACLNTLQEWFEAIRFQPDSCWKPPAMEVSFHLPLHRYYAAFLCTAVKSGVNVLHPSESQLRLLVMHPLQIQVARSEIGCRMWVRNGGVISYQSFLYAQSHFSAGFIDLDVYLLQVCASIVQPDWFVLTVFERFHLVNWLSMSAARPAKPFLQPEWEMPMVEGALRLLVVLVSNTLMLGMSDREAMRFELATLLCIGDKTHSQLLEQLPDRGNSESGASGGGKASLFEQIIAEVADYKPPQFQPGTDTMSQGIYTPKDIVWEELFDPVFVFIRSLGIREYQAALERYFDFLKRSGRGSKGDKRTQSWPPFRIPAPASVLPTYEPLRRVLHCRSTLGVLFSILYKALSAPTAISDESLMLSVQLLRLSIAFLPTASSPTAASSGAHLVLSPPSSAASARKTVLDLQYCGWFPPASTAGAGAAGFLANLAHRIERVLVVENFPGLSRSVSDETESEFPDLIRLRGGGQRFAPSTTQAASQQADAGQCSPAVRRRRGDQRALVPCGEMSVSRTSGGEIPYIDIEQLESDAGDAELYYSEVWASLPPALRREWVAGAPPRAAITFDEEEERMEVDDAEGEQRAIGTPLITEAASSEDEEGERGQADDGSSSPTFVAHGDDDETASAMLMLEGPSEGAAEATSEGTIALASVEDAGHTPKKRGGGLRRLAHSREPLRLPPSPGDSRRALPQPTVQVVETGGESLISMLIKLHNRLSGETGAGGTPYAPPPRAADAGAGAAAPRAESFGGAPSTAVAHLLDAIAATGDERARREIEAVCAALAETRLAAVEAQRASEQVARKAAAKERQKRLMDQFSVKQKAALEQLLKQEGTGEAASAAAGDKSYGSDEASFAGSAPGPSSFCAVDDEERPPSSAAASDTASAQQCVICSQQSSTAALLDEPVALIVLILATNVIGKERTAGSPAPTIDDDGGADEPPLRAVAEAKLDGQRWRRAAPAVTAANFDAANFDVISSMLATAPAALRCSGGVVVQTCGHCIHVECHSSYMKALRRDANSGQLVGSGALAVDKGEFFCPLCRRLANAVLPIVPAGVTQQLDAELKAIADAQDARARDERAARWIADVIDDFPQRSPIANTRLSTSIDDFFARLCNTSFKQYVDTTIGHDGFEAFFAGVVGTNLELIEMLANEKALVAKRFCVAALFDLACAEIIELGSPHGPIYRALFARLSGMRVEDDDGILQATDVLELPVLLMDPFGVLVQFALLAGFRAGRNEHVFATLFRIMLNVQFIRACLSVLLERNGDMLVPPLDDALSPSVASATDALFGAQFAALVGRVSAAGTPSARLSEAAALAAKSASLTARIVAEVKRRCGAFVGLCARLKRLTFSQSAMSTADESDSSASFDRLLRYCAFAPEGAGDDSLFFYRGGVGGELVERWLQELFDVLRQLDVSDVLDSLTSSVRVWSSARLIRLPPQYQEAIFQRYHSARCAKCGRTPRETLICLVCGRLVCYRDACCSVEGLSEVEMHTIDCGASTGVYLNVSSSMTLVVRGKRVAVWGSLYLDSHGEEDANLKRGKPLFLSADRFALLEAQWQAQLFDWTCRAWTSLAAPAILHHGAAAANM